MIAVPQTKYNFPYKYIEGTFIVIVYFVILKRIFKINIKDGHSYCYYIFLFTHIIEFVEN